jgi:hypothetical protein
VSFAGKWTALALVCSAGCALPDPMEHCLESCRFYSDCTPELEPLEEMCVTSCNERFADPMRIIESCDRSEPRHVVDQYRSIPSVRASAIEAGQCTLDRGCPPEMPPMNEVDPCDGIERICLDALTRPEICARGYDVQQYRCNEGYQACIMRGEDVNACSVQNQSCYDQANVAFDACSRST